MAWSRCTRCQYEFTSVSAFEKHLTQPKAVKTGTKFSRGTPTCKQPVDVGLVFIESKNAWGFPGGDYNFPRKETKVTDINTEPIKAPKVKELAKLFCTQDGCDAEIERTGKRGRPPTKCPAHKVVRA